MAGTPGACSQVFCHPIRCMRCAFISTETCSLHEARTTNTTTTNTTTTTTTNTTNNTTNTTTNTTRLEQVVLPFFGVTVWSKSRLLTSMEVGGAVTSAAKRRRERRLRSWWRHEAQSVKAAVATVLHHSCDVGRESYNVPRHQKMATAREEVVHEPHVALRGLMTPPPGTRPAPLVEVRPQGAMMQHSGIFELVQIPDVPVLQMVEQPVEVASFFRLSLPAVAEQVIEVPKLSLPGRAVQRAALPEPQLVEQLVEVPTVSSFSMLQQRTAEQVVDTPVSPGRGRGARGGLPGSYGQGSTAYCGSENVVSPALHAREGSRGGVPGLSQGRGSSSFSGADNVVSPALHARGVSRGGHQGLSQGQGSTAVCGADTVVSSASQRRGGGARGGRPGLSQGQGSSAVCVEQNMSTLLFLMVVLEIEVLNVFLVDRVPLRLPSSRLLLRLLIGRCHKPLFMAVMTSGFAWLMRIKTPSTTGTAGMTLLAGGCRGESSTAGAGSPLGFTGMWCWGRSSGFFPLFDLHPGRYGPEGLVCRWFSFPQLQLRSPPWLRSLSLWIFVPLLSLS